MPDAVSPCTKVKTSVVPATLEYFSCSCDISSSRTIRIEIWENVGDFPSTAGKNSIMLRTNSTIFAWANGTAETSSIDVRGLLNGRRDAQE